MGQGKSMWVKKSQRGSRRVIESQTITTRPREDYGQKGSKGVRGSWRVEKGQEGSGRVKKGQEGSGRVKEGQGGSRGIKDGQGGALGV